MIFGFVEFAIVHRGTCLRMQLPV